MGLFSSIGNIVHKVTSVVDKVTNFIKAPLSFITKPLTSLVDKLVDKLPFGLGKLVEPFVNKFLGTAVSWLAGGPLGGIMSMLSSIAPAAEGIDKVLDVADGVLNGGLKSLPSLALQNVQELSAFSQAQSLLAA